MHKLIKLTLIAGMLLSASACSKVPAGNVGVKVYLLGTSKGVDTEQLSPGRYWIGINEELFLFPTFTQNYVWTKDITEASPSDESITFQTREGLSVNTDVGVSYSVDPAKASVIFQKYRKGVEEITRVYLRNMVRDAFVTLSSSEPIETVYGVGKAKLVENVLKHVRAQVQDIGIIVEGIYLIGDLRLPPTVITAINAKIEATQKAQQRENEVRQAEAEAKKKVEEAKGQAASILEVANAQAQANKTIAASLTEELVKYKSIEKWDGVLPKFTGGPIPLVQIEN
jgi:regulator of protease activity HflC (stomatin/prohibitin superfamily)